MSWNDFYRRRDVIDATLRLARRDPDGTLPFDKVPHAAEVFSGPDELLQALQYKWTQLLTGRIGLALSAAEHSPSVDRVEAVASAWQQTAAEHEVLRRVLDAHATTTLSGATAREQRMLALAAGLAEMTEPAEVIERIGSAFAVLLRGNTTPTVDRKAAKHGLARLLG